MGSKGSAAGPGRWARRWGAFAGAAALGLLSGTVPAAADSADHPGGQTATPVKHLVVLFQENVSFDHYFGAYPVAANTDGTKFTADKHTPKDINTLRNAGLLTKNPNQYLPKRLTPEQAMTCDQNHSYGPEQYAANGGKADQLRPEHRLRQVLRQPVRRARPGHGLLRRQHRHRDVELRPALLARRQLLQHHLRPFHAGRDQPRLRADPRRDLHRPRLGHRAPQADRQARPVHGRSRRTPRASARWSTTRTRPTTTARTRTTPARTRWRRCRAATSVTCSTSEGELGLVPGRLPAEHRLGRQAGRLREVLRHHPHQRGRRGGRRLQPAPLAVPVLQVDVQPAPPAAQEHRRDRPRRAGQPQLRPHRLRRRAQDGQPAGGELPEGAGVPGRPRRLLRPDRRAALPRRRRSTRSSSRRSGRTPRSSSPTTTPTAGTTTPTPRRRTARRTPSPAPTARPPTAPPARPVPPPPGATPTAAAPAPRQPLLVISPYSKVNSVDHTRTEQASITRFIEDNWRTGRIGDASFDTRAELAGLGRSTSATPTASRCC